MLGAYRKTLTSILSLRKILRDQAAKELKVIVADTQTYAIQRGKKAGIGHNDLLRIAAGGRTDSLTAKAITDMAKYKEAELEKFYNAQLKLPIEGSDKKGKVK